MAASALSLPTSLSSSVIWFIAIRCRMSSRGLPPSSRGKAGHAGRGRPFRHRPQARSAARSIGLDKGVDADALAGQRIDSAGRHRGHPHIAAALPRLPGLRGDAACSALGIGPAKQTTRDNCYRASCRKPIQTREGRERRSKNSAGSRRHQMRREGAPLLEQMPEILICHPSVERSPRVDGGTRAENRSRRRARPASSASSAAWRDRCG